MGGIRTILPNSKHSGDDSPSKPFLMVRHHMGSPTGHGCLWPTNSDLWLHSHRKVGDLSCHLEPYKNWVENCNLEIGWWNFTTIYKIVSDLKWRIPIHGGTPRPLVSMLKWSNFQLFGGTIRTPPNYDIWCRSRSWALNEVVPSDARHSTGQCECVRQTMQTP